MHLGFAAVKDGASDAAVSQHPGHHITLPLGVDKDHHSFVASLPAK